MNEQLTAEQRLGIWFRRMAEWLGWMFLLLWVLASLNLIDLHICLKAAGECHP